MKCRGLCDNTTRANIGLCWSCQRARSNGLGRIKAEGLLLDTAGGSWWVWDKKGTVLVLGKDTRDKAAIALGMGIRPEDE